jgi:hypothetical protein
VRLDDIGKGYEEMIIRLGWMAIDAEKASQGKPKYARVARVFIPTLRKIFYKGYYKRAAQLLMEEMYLQSTVPLNDLNDSYGGAGNNYYQLDSYTNQPLDMTIDEERKFIGNEAAPIAPPLSDGLTARIVEVAPEQANFSRENYDVSEDVWYEDREREDGWVVAENTQMMKLNMGEVYALIRTMRKLYPKKNKNGESILLWWLNNIAPGNYEPQSLLVVMSCFNLDEVWKDIPCILDEPYTNFHIKTLQDLDYYFGDDIIDEFNMLYDEVTDREGANRDALNEDDIERIGRQFELDIIQKQFTYKADDIKHTKSYAKGVFDALATGQADLTSAGYRRWRFLRSKQGSAAFDYAYTQALLKGKSEKQALKAGWTAFWKAGVIFRIGINGVTIKIEAKNKLRTISWTNLLDEITSYVVRLSTKEESKLLDHLTTHNWGQQFLDKYGM